MYAGIGCRTQVSASAPRLNDGSSKKKRNTEPQFEAVAFGSHLNVTQWDNNEPYYCIILCIWVVSSQHRVVQELSLLTSACVISVASCMHSSPENVWSFEAYCIKSGPQVNKLVRCLHTLVSSMTTWAPHLPH